MDKVPWILGGDWGLGGLLVAREVLHGPMNSLLAMPCMLLAGTCKFSFSLLIKVACFKVHCFRRSRQPQQSLLPE